LILTRPRPRSRWERLTSPDATSIASYWPGTRRSSQPRPSTKRDPAALLRAGPPLHPCPSSGPDRPSSPLFACPTGFAGSVFFSRSTWEQRSGRDFVRRSTVVFSGSHGTSRHDTPCVTTARRYCGLRAQSGRFENSTSWHSGRTGRPTQLRKSHRLPRFARSLVAVRSQTIQNYVPVPSTPTSIPGRSSRLGALSSQCGFLPFESARGAFWLRELLAEHVRSRRIVKTLGQRTGAAAVFRPDFRRTLDFPNARGMFSELVPAGT